MHVKLQGWNMSSLSGGMPAEPGDLFAQPPLILEGVVQQPPAVLHPTSPLAAQVCFLTPLLFLCNYLMLPLYSKSSPLYMVRAAVLCAANQ